MIRYAIALLALATSACMTGSQPSGGLDNPDAPPTACNTTEAQQFIGRTATNAIGRSVIAMSDARVLRWGGPDTAFTMDYRTDRVNVIYDAGGTITRIYCG